MAEPLAEILPQGAVAVERGTIGRGQDPTALPELYPVEETLVAGASDARRREFAEARACAREALAALGVPPCPIPAGADGAPVWPEGVVGSITHKGGYRAAVVARAEDLAGIGIDAEPDERLPEGVLEAIATPRELDQVEELLERRGGVAWDRLLFCAKEAAVKAAHPGVDGIRDIEVRFDPGTRRFVAAAASGGGERQLAGGWVASNGRLLALASAPQPRT